MLLQVVLFLLVTGSMCLHRYGLPEDPRHTYQNNVNFLDKRERTLEQEIDESDTAETEAQLPEPTSPPVEKDSSEELQLPNTEPPEPPELRTNPPEPPEVETAPPSPPETSASPPTEPPRQTTTKEPKSTVRPVEKEPAPSSTYALWNADGKICVLAKFDASFTIEYQTIKFNQESAVNLQEVAVNLPKTASVKGRCGTASENPRLQLSWGPGFRFTFTFAEAPRPNEDSPYSWHVTSMELQYDTSQPLFDKAIPYENTSAKTVESSYFTTPMNMSYLCPSPDVITLHNKVLRRKIILRMKNVQLQPYRVRKGTFSSASRCSQVQFGGEPEPYVRDETIPIAVGSTLAVLTLLSVGGFAVYRAVTVRRVDYSTME